VPFFFAGPSLKCRFSRWFTADEIVTTHPPTPVEDCVIAIRVRRSFVKKKCPLAEDQCSAAHTRNENMAPSGIHTYKFVPNCTSYPSTVTFSMGRAMTPLQKLAFDISD
jgi:hypothetical protein